MVWFDVIVNGKYVGKGVDTSRKSYKEIARAAGFCSIVTAWKRGYMKVEYVYINESDTVDLMPTRKTKYAI